MLQHRIRLESTTKNVGIIIKHICVDSNVINNLIENNQFVLQVDDIDTYKGIITNNINSLSQDLDVVINALLHLEIDVQDYCYKNLAHYLKYVDDIKMFSKSTINILKSMKLPKLQTIIDAFSTDVDVINWKSGKSIDSKIRSKIEWYHAENQKSIIIKVKKNILSIKNEKHSEKFNIKKFIYEKIKTLTYHSFTYSDDLNTIGVTFLADNTLKTFLFKNKKYMRHISFDYNYYVDYRLSEDGNQFVILNSNSTIEIFNIYNSEMMIVNLPDVTAVRLKPYNRFANELIRLIFN